MQISSQGLNFLGLTVKKYETGAISNNSLQAVQQKLEAFGEVSNGLAQTPVALSNLKDLNSQAYCVIDGKKQPITEKSWDRGGILEGKVPLEEGIAKGLYHIESAPKKDVPAESEDLDGILAELQEKVSSDEASKAANLPQAPSSKAIESNKKSQSKLDFGDQSSFKFIS